MTSKSLCFTCKEELPAGGYSAFCQQHQPRDTRPLPPGTSVCRCPRCGEDFPNLQAFDEHMAISHGPDTKPLRTSRRTSIVQLGPDTVRLCDPECRNEVLADLGVPGGRGAWTYPGHGAATVTVAWSGKTYDIAWKRVRPSALPCDACWDEWMYRIPAAVAQAKARSERMKGVRTTGLTPFSAQEAA